MFYQEVEELGVVDRSIFESGWLPFEPLDAHEFRVVVCVHKWVGPPSARSCCRGDGRAPISSSARRFAERRCAVLDGFRCATHTARQAGGT